MQDINIIYADLKDKVRKPPYGVSDALITLFGEEKGTHIAKMENVLVRGMTSKGHKRSLPDDAEFGDDGPVPGPSSKRRV
jgi:hypothetical protein